MDNGISKEKYFSDCSENPMCAILSCINNDVLFVNYNQNFFVLIACPMEMVISATSRAEKITTGLKINNKNQHFVF
jgi:hypothetical protein